MKQRLLPFAEVLLGAGLLVGCTSDPKIGDDFAQSMSTPDIQEQIISTFRSVYGETPNGLRAVSNEKVGSNETYISNFAEGGFILYGVDSIGQLILHGISDKGSLFTRDSAENPLLKNILDRAVCKTSVLDGVIKDLDCGRIHPKPDPNPSDPPCSGDFYPRYETRVMNVRTEIPMQPKTLDFGQDEPFTNFLHTAGENGHDALGCANTALAMLYSHYELPKVIQHQGKDVIIEWERLRALNGEADPSDSDKQWCKLLLQDPNLSYQMALLGCYIYYKTGHLWSDGSVTSVQRWRVRRFLKDHNFNPKVVDYNKNFSEFFDYLKTVKKPVLVFWKGDSRWKNWHYWVFDGYFEQRYDEISFKQEYPNGPWKQDHLVREVIQKTYVHCNWGWNGGGNGYFSFDLLIPGDLAYYRTPNEPWEPSGLRTILPEEKQNYKLDAEVFLVYPKGLAEKWIVE